MVFVADDSVLKNEEEVELGEEVPFKSEVNDPVKGWVTFMEGINIVGSEEEAKESPKKEEDSVVNERGVDDGQLVKGEVPAGSATILLAHFIDNIKPL